MSFSFFIFLKMKGERIMYKKLIENLALEILKTKNNDDLEMLEDAENDFSYYVKTVTDMENGISIAKFRLEGEEHRNYIKNLDNQRRSAHNAAIVSVKILNKFCNLYNADPIFTGNIENRIEVGNFCMEVVNELFENRRLN